MVPGQALGGEQVGTEATSHHSTPCPPSICRHMDENIIALQNLGCRKSKRGKGHLDTEQMLPVPWPVGVLSVRVRKP